MVLAMKYPLACCPHMYVIMYFRTYVAQVYDLCYYYYYYYFQSIWYSFIMRIHFYYETYTMIFVFVNCILMPDWFCLSLKV